MTNERNSTEQWFLDQLARGDQDPDALTDRLLLDVTEQIWQRLEQMDLRPKDLAERLGVSRAYVSQLLNGKPNMTMRTLVAVAHALEESVAIRLEPATPTIGAGSRETPDQALLHQRKGSGD